MDKGEVPIQRSCVSWVPLGLLSATELAVWFVTTFIVLLPLVAPNTAFDSLLPTRQYQPTHLESAVGWLLLIVYQVLFALFSISVMRTVATPPGSIPSWLRSDGRSDLHSYSNLLQAVERKKKSGAPRYCRKTGAYKPDRAHYCHDVDRCVLQYQTFSYIFNAPIGFYNYKFYLLSLFYGTLTSAWVVGATLPEVISWSRRLHDDPAQTQRLHAFYLSLLRASLTLGQGEEAALMCIIITLALNVLLVIPCFVLFVFHTVIIAQGRTAYEWQQVRAGARPREVSLFDYGVLNNFALTLGIYPLLWLVPTRRGMEGNGIFFPEKHHALHSW